MLCSAKSNGLSASQSSGFRAVKSNGYSAVQFSGFRAT